MDQAPAFQAGDAGSIPAGRSNLNRTSSGRPSGTPAPSAASFTLVIGDGRPGEVARRHLFEAAMGLNGVALLEDRTRTRRSRGFESLQVHHGDVAHLEERRVRTAKAAGSSPAVSTAPRRWSGWSRTPFRKRLGGQGSPRGFESLHLRTVTPGVAAAHRSLEPAGEVRILGGQLRVGPSSNAHDGLSRSRLG
jgi:hypothetical protein